jgi:hypothetical protein
MPFGDRSILCLQLALVSQLRQLAAISLQQRETFSHCQRRLQVKFLLCYLPILADAQGM